MNATHFLCFQLLLVLSAGGGSLVLRGPGLSSCLPVLLPLGSGMPIMQLIKKKKKYRHRRLSFSGQFGKKIHFSVVYVHLPGTPPKAASPCGEIPQLLRRLLPEKEHVTRIPSPHSPHSVFGVAQRKPMGDVSMDRHFPRYPSARLHSSPALSSFAKRRGDYKNKTL